MPSLSLTPPLLNSACPWATTLEDLRTLYHLPTTGAVTTRTSMVNGFPHDSAIHQHTFFDLGSSLNTYGYSPHPLEFYLDAITTILATDEDGNQIAGTPSPADQKKPFIVSVTGTPEGVAECVRRISAQASEKSQHLWVELNLSCPNIPGIPPPAYSPEALLAYLTALPSPPSLPIGVKLPPYTYSLQFSSFLEAAAPFFRNGALRFVTSTNTLGNCLVLGEAPTLDPQENLPHFQPELSSADHSGIGGMAGRALHPLALGNVRTLKKGLEERGLEDVFIIGIGGVGDKDGWVRMRRVGAGAVGVATALGQEGVGVFAKIMGLDEQRMEAERMGVNPAPN